MRSKKMMYWLCGVPLTAAALILLILILEPDRSYMPRTVATKAMALSVTDKESCEAWKQGNVSFFPTKDQGEWYVKYMDYLFSEGYLSQEFTKANDSFAKGNLTYQEAFFFATQMGIDTTDLLPAGKENSSKGIPEDIWWNFYELGVLKSEKAKGVLSESVMIYGSPANVDATPKWRAYTSLGQIGFEGLVVDPYIDKEIQVYIKGQEIIKVQAVVSDQVVYKNVWLTVNEKDLQVLVGGITRIFPVPGKKSEREGFHNQLADLTLKDGKLELIQLKKTTITGKVLSVREDSIEVEGYGALPLSEDFKVYKTYGDLREQKKKDILVGYDMQEFVVADGEICAALTKEPFDVQNIRVLIMNTGFRNLYHSQLSFTFQGDVRLLYGEEEETLPAGSELTIFAEDSRFSEGRLVIEPLSKETLVTVGNIERGQGIPSYPGTLEVYREGSDLYLINEVDLEQYLERVVPSEMPASYEKEALKVQAVCARTYAYKQIQTNYYSQYGAHVDDSTRFQVYNNIETSDKTREAISETYGEMVLLEDQPVEAYYFSTSCGFSTDGTVWGAKPEEVPYLKGTALREDRKVMDFSKEESFAEFIKNDKFVAYDSEFPLYRWKTTVTCSQLEKRITGIGSITSITMVERGSNGIGKTLKITGTEGEKILSDQSQIRNVLGSSDLVFTNRNGNTFTGWDSLPSAFISVEAIDNTTYAIYGGGYGHGVGMSQNGAQGMAKAGKNYKEILQFFYTGVEIQ